MLDGGEHQVYYTVDLGYVKGIYLVLNALLFLLLLCPSQHLVEFALVGWRGREPGSMLIAAG